MNSDIVLRRSLAALSLATVFAVGAFAQVHPAQPSFSSRPGAAYTLFLNFAGFSFAGVWGGSLSPSGTPGVTPAYTVDGDATTFNASELTNIKNVWARVAEKYVAFNVNVTTVDPSAAAGQNGNDSQRQAYYDSQARMMHTVIGGGGGWSGGGGVSFINTTKNAYNPAGQNGGAGPGFHTNWVFSAQAPSNLQFIGEATAHEDGHGLNVLHQSDFNAANQKVNEYSSGNGTGSGSYAPIMGNSYSAQRGTWRIGDTGSTNNRRTQNDVVQILGNTNMTLMDDGIGHTMGTATPLAVSSGAVDSMQAKGFIAPSSSASPQAIGENNYTKDYFAFRATGGLVTLTLRNGSQYINVGQADPGATLKSKLRIFDGVGNLVGTSVQDGSTMFSTFSMSLGTGDYFAEVSSFGGFSHTGSFGTQLYYEMGSYFLTGSGVQAVPEPASMVALGLGALALLRRRRKA